MSGLSNYERESLLEHLAELDLLIEEDDGTFFSLQFIRDHEILKKLIKGETV